MHDDQHENERAGRITMTGQVMLLAILVGSLALSVLIARALLELVLAGMMSSQHRAENIESDVSVAGVHPT